MSDTDATRARHDVVADVDEILEHVINGNMLSMPYDVYTELFDAVDGLGVKAEKTEAENAKLRELVRNLWRVIPADVTGVVIGANTDHPTYYKFDEAFRELGIEVDE